MSGVIEAFAIGTKVTIGNGIPGTITGIAYYGNYLQYRVAWWNGAARVVEWLECAEVEPTEKSPRKIGFHAPDESAKYEAARKVSQAMATMYLIGDRTTA